MAITCQACGKTWRYEFNHTKSEVVTFGETKPTDNTQLMREHEWMLGEFVVDELFEYKNLEVLKNYMSSFALNVDDNIEKVRHDFSSDFNRRKRNLLVYVNFWKQACLPSLLFGTSLFILNASRLIKLECCQQRFLTFCMSPSLFLAHSYSNFLV